jgi:hypothetical protein
MARKPPTTAAERVCQMLGLDPARQWRHVDIDVTWAPPTRVSIIATAAAEDGSASHTTTLSYVDEEATNAASA